MEFIFQIIIIVVIWGWIASAHQKEQYWKEMKKPVKHNPNAPKQVHCWDIITLELYNTFQESIGSAPKKDPPEMYSLDNRVGLAYRRAKKICDERGIYWWSSRYDD